MRMIVPYGTTGAYYFPVPVSGLTLSLSFNNVKLLLGTQTYARQAAWILIKLGGNQRLKHFVIACYGSSGIRMCLVFGRSFNSIKLKISLNTLIQLISYCFCLQADILCCWSLAIIYILKTRFKIKLLQDVCDFK